MIFGKTVTTKIPRKLLKHSFIDITQYIWLFFTLQLKYQFVVDIQSVDYQQYSTFYQWGRVF